MRIAGDPEQLVHKALNVLCIGGANEQAFRVIEAAGINYYGDFIWWREEKKLNAELARTILRQAKSDGSYDGPIQEDDTQVVKEAERFVKMARDAWNANIRGPEVETVLRLADAPEEVVSRANEGNGEVQAGQPTEADVQAAEEVIASGEIKVDALTTEEPWEDYVEESVTETCEALDTWKRDDPEIEQVFHHVRAYETANRGSKRVLKRVDEFFQEQERDREAKPEDPAPQERPAEDPAPSEVDAGAEDGAQGSEADSPQPEAAPDGEPDAPSEPEGEVDQPDTENRRGEVASTPPRDSADREEYRELVEAVEHELEAQRIHVPPDAKQIDPSEFDLPFDLTTLSNQKLQYFHGVYTHLYYRCNYELTIEEAKARACKGAADSLFRYLIVNLPQYDSHNKPRTVTMIEAEAELDENLLAWRGRQHKHEAFASAHRNERDSYKQIIDSLSRTETMRHNEFERAGK